MPCRSDPFLGCRVSGGGADRSRARFTAIAGTALNIAWILFVVSLILFVVFAGLRRRKRIEGTMPSRRGSALTRSLAD